MPPLTEDQRTVLEALMVQNASPEDRTEAELIVRTGNVAVVGVLRELEAFDPPLVVQETDTTLGTRFWWATPAGGDALEARR